MHTSRCGLPKPIQTLPMANSAAHGMIRAKKKTNMPYQQLGPLGEISIGCTRRARRWWDDVTVYFFQGLSLSFSPHKLMSLAPFRLQT